MDLKKINKDKLVFSCFTVLFVVALLLYPSRILGNPRLMVVYICIVSLLFKLQEPKKVINLAIYLLSMSIMLVLVLNNIAFRYEIIVTLYTLSMLIYHLSQFKNKYRYITIFLVIALSFSVIYVDNVKRNQALIKDRALEKTIMNKVSGNGTLTKENLKEITNLWVWDEFAYTLEGLQYCENLENLNVLSATNNIDKIYNLGNLKSLALSNIVSTDSECNLYNLEILQLYGVKKKHINEITKFNNIREIYLSKMKLDNLNFLSEFNNLKVIEISKCEIGSLEGLENLSKIRDIEVKYSEINDISPLNEISHSVFISNLKSELGNQEELNDNIKIYIKEESIIDKAIYQ